MCDGKNCYLWKNIQVVEEYPGWKKKLMWIIFNTSLWWWEENSTVSNSLYPWACLQRWPWEKYINDGANNKKLQPPAFLSNSANFGRFSVFFWLLKKSACEEYGTLHYIQYNMYTACTTYTAYTMYATWNTYTTYTMCTTCTKYITYTFIWTKLHCTAFTLNTQKT